MKVAYFAYFIHLTIFDLRFLFATDEVLDELRTRLETVVRQGVRVLTYNYSAAWHLGRDALRSLEAHRNLLHEDLKSDNWRINMN